MCGSDEVVGDERGSTLDKWSVRPRVRTVGRRTASAARPTLHPFTSSAAEAFASTRTVREPFTPPFARALSASGALMPTQVADIFFSLFSLWCVCVSAALTLAA